MSSIIHILWQHRSRMVMAAGMASFTFVMVNTHAEESLLWKAVNTNPPAVVPAYGGQGSPFPTVAEPVQDTSETDVMDEQSRLREEAFNNANNIVKSGNALVPDLRRIAVGGVVDGNLGPRVLINNQWLGVGGKLKARQYKTAAAEEAVKALIELDSMAGEEINQALNAELSQNPTITLTVSKITSSSMILSGPKGNTVIKINQNSM